MLILPPKKETKIGSKEPQNRRTLGYARGLMNRPITESVYEESCTFIPGGVNSPVRAFKGMGMIPLVLKEGRGETIIDVDGNEYIDFCQSWGALILGHSPRPVVESLQEQLPRGTTFGVTTPLEKALAQRIIQHLPSIEQLRFMSTGTEAVMTAVRLARGFTRKSLVIKFDGHFHGHSDSLLIQAGSGVTHLPKASSQGVPDSLASLTHSLPFNETEKCRNYIRSRQDIAAIVVEPIAANMGVVPATLEFLQMLREESDRAGIVLIFDEVVTGFRVGLNGAQGLYGISPDLTCLGKVIGGGLPAAACGGRKEIMEHIAPLGEVYQGGTLSGNPLAMCAGLATFDVIEEPGFFPDLASKTKKLLDPVSKLIEEKDLPVTIHRVASMFTLFFGVKQVTGREEVKQVDEKRFQQCFKFLFNSGVYLSPSPYEAHFLSSAHTKEGINRLQEGILTFISSL